MHRTLFPNFLLVQRQFFVYAPKNLFLRLRIPKKNCTSFFHCFRHCEDAFFFVFEELFSK